MEKLSKLSKSVMNVHTQLELEHDSFYVEVSALKHICSGDWNFYW